MAAQGPHQTTLVQAPWGRIECEPGYQVKSDVSGLRFQVQTPQGKVLVARGGDWWILQFPDQTVRVRQTENATGQEVLVQYKGENYHIKQSPREWEWKFPDDHAYFHYVTGFLREALGDRGTFQVHHNTHLNTYLVSSEAGESSFGLHTRKQTASHHTLYSLQKLSGQGPEKYPYLVKAVCFRENGLSIFVDMPGGPLTAGLGAGSIRTYEGDTPAISTHPANSGTAAGGSGAGAAKPLDAQTSGSDNDPLNLGNTRTHRDQQDVLRVRTGAESGVLQVKEYDPSATSPSQ